MSGASFANALSVLDTAHLGALEAQLGASNFAFLGSLSLRGVTRFVSSLAERARVGSSLAVVDVLSLGSSLSVRRFLIMPLTISVFTHIVRILRSVTACSGSSLQLHSIWSFSLGLQFGSLRIGIFSVCFGLYSFRELSLSQRLSVLWLRLVSVHEFGCELILCRVPLIWVRRCHSSLLTDLVHL